MRLGIEPSELHFMPMDVFIARFREKDLAEIAYNHHETVRQVSLYCEWSTFLSSELVCHPCVKDMA